MNLERIKNITTKNVVAKSGEFNVVGIKFKNNGKVYYFNSNDLELSLNDIVLVDSHGLHNALVVYLGTNDFKPTKNILEIVEKNTIIIEEEVESTSFYEEIVNALINIGLTENETKDAKKYKLGRNVKAMIKESDDDILLYVGLDTKLQKKKWNCIDLSMKKTYENTPLMIRVNDFKSLNNALEMINKLKDVL